MPFKNLKKKNLESHANTFILPFLVEHLIQLGLLCNNLITGYFGVGWVIL
jgi:hypothetical protein